MQKELLTENGCREFLLLIHKYYDIALKYPTPVQLSYYGYSRYAVDAYIDKLKQKKLLQFEEKEIFGHTPPKNLPPDLRIL